MSKELQRKMSLWAHVARRTTAHFALFSVLHAIYRFMKRQGRPYAVRIHRHDKRPFYMRPGTTDWSTFYVTFVCREYEFVKHHLESARTILDLGANIGDSTRFFADAFPRAQIVAVEPDEMNAKVCEMNVDACQASDRIMIKQCFIGEVHGYAGIDRSAGSWAYKMAPVHHGGELVKVCTVGELLDDLNIKELDLMKCDIEGAEQDVFATCSDWIYRVRHLVIETSHPYSIEAMEKDLKKNGWNYSRLYYALPDGYHELALFKRINLAGNRADLLRGDL